MRGATALDKSENKERAISIHAPRAGRDRGQARRDHHNIHFNPRAPCGARHDLRAGQGPRSEISIHAPRAGRDASSRLVSVFFIKFQSTRPVRGATRSPCGQGRHSRYFKPRAPCGARLSTVPLTKSLVYFNPRAPCGARPRTPFRPLFPANFNPRAPCGARRSTVYGALSPCYFNPRAPCGARRPCGWAFLTPPRFQSTRPVRGATVSCWCCPLQSLISIHAPHAGRDLRGRPAFRQPENFNPRAPCGARRVTTAIC